jgi:hypothetical protein
MIVSLSKLRVTKWSDFISLLGFSEDKCSNIQGENGRIRSEGDMFLVGDIR